jgi:hypothetical protein
MPISKMGSRKGLFATSPRARESSYSTRSSAGRGSEHRSMALRSLFCRLPSQRASGARRKPTAIRTFQWNLSWVESQEFAHIRVPCFFTSECTRGRPFYPTMEPKILHWAKFGTKSSARKKHPSCSFSHNRPRISTIPLSF